MSDDPDRRSPVRVVVLAHTPRRLADPLAAAVRDAGRAVHAGGFTSTRTLADLRELARVDAVLGSSDFALFGDELPEVATLEIGGARLLVTNMIGTPQELLAPVRRRVREHEPDVVVHAHAPEADVSWVGGTLFLNPGSAGGRATQAPPTYGLLEIEGPGRITAHVREFEP